MFRLMCGGITQQLCERIATMCERSVRCLGECSSICFGICRSSSGICLEFGFVVVLTAVVWNSPGICLEFFLLCGVLSGICGVWLASSWDLLLLWYFDNWSSALWLVYICA
ncbi:unnamed protein product [Meloidogyne enterolobii]|uniref:Uncharacterized protein n=1 Tax=Meloidogyne enterolobii TaxID=390850 RepID=A0ACB0Y089_MELEN